jgi:uncharacterized repeat protein (TIGR03803 family)
MFKGELLMRGEKLSIGLRATLAIFALTLLTTSTWAATEKKLHNFGITDTDGHDPLGALIFDAAGNLYGTTFSGGDKNNGTVFEVSPNGSGGWTEKVLHSFGHGTDGIFPNPGLALDAAGNLYGTTYEGGYEQGQCAPDGCGTVFELTPNDSGGWTEKVLHNFNLDEMDGIEPDAGVILDGAGNLYGTTALGGDYYGGTVFEVLPAGGGRWTEKKLLNFHQRGNIDGALPQGGLVFDNAGNLYGTTSIGGDYCQSNGNDGCGTVFELTSNGSGGWAEKKLHSFGIDGTDGTNPFSDLTFDAAGNLYGTTPFGGDYSGGTVFQLTPNGSGGWTEKKLHNFGSYPQDGYYPSSSLTFDAAGNLYGGTSEGGDNFCEDGYTCGTVFELTPNSSGGWTETKLHNFGADDTDGVGPGGVILDSSGNLYGITGSGGDYYCGASYPNCGTVFEITP